MIEAGAGVIVLDRVFRTSTVEGPAHSGESVALRNLRMAASAGSGIDVPGDGFRRRWRAMG